MLYLYLVMHLKRMSKLRVTSLIIIISFASSKSVMINNGLNDIEQTNPKLIEGRYIFIPFLTQRQHTPEIRCH